MTRTQIKHLLYKEWIKTRWYAAVGLAGSLILSVYACIDAVSMLHDMGGTFFYSTLLTGNIALMTQLKYLPLAIALLIGLPQFLPEITNKRIRLTLHLPVGNRTLIAGMALYGLLLLTLFNAIVLALFCFKNSALFPAEVTVPVRETVLGWFLAAYWVYNYIAFTALEPNRMRQLFYALTGLVLLSLYLYDVPFHGAYSTSMPVLALLALLSCPLVLFSGYRLNKGER